ncbi:hypothetical protein M8C21_009765 [Ambrosia artemisiifolia]|uniref:AP2/ERF domain-containing protein n=1 Tax=Ambrosia artemisiifolia TaxID=4212 RepID=A0AAD5GE90_AMBAR|nr:hypothetical protein M8C21_009765 [Ambrosia artemisiifolia]
MWDLNGSPDRITEDQEELQLPDYTNNKGKQVGGSISDSSSSVMVTDQDEAASNEYYTTTTTGDSRLFGFSMTDNPPVTHQFFPLGDTNEVGPTTTGGTGSVMSSYPMANWVGVKFCQQPSGGGGGVAGKVTDVPQPLKKSRRGPRSRSSQYRGVTFYRRTGRWESHIWDCGKQVYLGGFDTAHAAARAAIKFRGVEADINFTLEDYEDDLKQPYLETPL